MFPEQISISNFRCFKHKTEMHHRPITVNIGANNSGKSSFIKCLNLLNHSVNYNLNRPGLNSLKEFGLISLSDLTTFGIGNLGNPDTFLNERDKYFDITFKVPHERLPIELSSHNLSFGLTYLFIENPTNSISVSNDKDPFKSTFGFIKGIPGKGELIGYSIFINDKLLMSYQRSAESFYTDDNLYYDTILTFNNSILNSNLTLNANSNEDADEILTHKSQINEIEFILKKDLIKHISGELRLLEINYKNEIFLLNGVFQALEDFSSELSELSFIELNRNESRRFIDISGNSLLKNCIDAYFDTRLHKSPIIHETLTRLLKLFNIANQFSIEPDNVYGFIFKLQMEDESYRNIADLGSGVNQLLPLFMASALNIEVNKSAHFAESMGISYKDYNPKLLIVEEPETNLHPAFQSKLADLFCILHEERNLNFIIETHSEYMVRRFQYLVATGKILPQDIVINYFWVDSKTGQHKCKQIEIYKDGSLSQDFESGFYDEADKIALELFLLKQHQKN